MSEHDNSYEGMSIPAAPAPPADAIGHWWRRRWHFRFQSRPLTDLTLPPPIGQISDLSMIVTSQWVSDVELIVETFTTQEQYSGDELTYVSLVGAWLQACVPDNQIFVEGAQNHPILRMSRLGDDLIALIRSYGY